MLQHRVGLADVVVQHNDAWPQCHLRITGAFAKYGWTTAIRGGEFALASAVTLYQSVAGLVILVVANAIAGRFGREYRLI